MPVPTLVLTLLAIALSCGHATAQLQPPWVPPQNPSTPAKVMLGKILFWDEQLSSDDTMACGTCHLHDFGSYDGHFDPGLHPGPDGLYGTADDIHGAPGVAHQDQAGNFTPSSPFGFARQVTARRAPATVGAAHHAELFWDGRAVGAFVDPETGLTLIPYGGALESQATAPILDAVEMATAGRTWQDVRTKLQGATPLRLATNLPAAVQAALQQNPTYPLLFAAAFGTPSITGARIGMALASYQRTLNPDDTPWDRWIAGQSGAMTASEVAGWQLFQTSGQCTNCHGGDLFSDDLFHNLGLRFVAEDHGRGAFSGQPEDMGAFKTPTLRNAGLRPRLFHNGQSPSLGDPSQLTDPASTLNVYWNGGGVDPSNLSPMLAPLHQLGVMQADLVLIQEFVRTALTDARTAQQLPPFDHPQLRAQTAMPPRVFGPPLPGASTPLLVDTAPMYAGNAGFKLGLAGGDGATFAMLLFGTSSIEPHATALGLPLHLHPQQFLLFALNGSPGQPGHTTWRLPIPYNLSLPQGPYYFQLLVLDPLAAPGIASSRGWEWFLQ